MISANDLRNKSFSTVSDGYSVDEVNFIVDEAAKTIDAYSKESEELYHKLEVLAAKVEEYREEEDSIKDALIIAQKMSEKIKRESNEEAEALVSASKQKAKEILENANNQADKLITSAREYSSNLIKEKTDEANKIVSDAQAKANEAISSSKIVAQDVLNQAKAISDDLISTSKQEKEAYEKLVSIIKSDANEFVTNLKALYTEQLNALNTANFDVKADDTAAEDVDSIQNDVDSLINEIDEMESAIPSEINIATPVDEIKEDDTSVEDIISDLGNKIELPAEEPDVIPVVEETPASEDIFDTDIEEIDVPDEEEIIEDTIEEIEEDTEPADPMEAVAAFSQNEFTPIDTSAPYIPEISEDAVMEGDDEVSLFDDADDHLPFESYFNVNKEDAHSDRTKTISLIPPEDEDDEPKFKGFFKKKK